MSEAASATPQQGQKATRPLTYGCAGVDSNASPLSYYFTSYSFLLLTILLTKRMQEVPYDEIRVGRGPAFELRTEDLPGVAQTIDEEDE